MIHSLEVISGGTHGSKGPAFQGLKIFVSTLLSQVKDQLAVFPWRRD